jgi:hypothetical protein
MLSPAKSAYAPGVEHAHMKHPRASVEIGPAREAVTTTAW